MARPNIVQYSSFSLGPLMNVRKRRLGTIGPPRILSGMPDTRRK